jgi:hypothetical protein
VKTSARRIATIFACCIVILPLRSLPRGRNNQVSKLPQYVLWAWERPEDLRFINPQDTAVAFLSNTIHLHDDGVVVRPRLQPLLVPKGTELIAVTRIEADPHAALSWREIEQSAAAVARNASLPHVIAVQVDFDATLSQRDFYRALLVDVRERLGPEMPISITALASWCFDDNWISDLPIDEAVPMLFRMGADTGEIVTRLNSGHDFRSAACKGSLGVSIDEPWTSLPAGRRLYVFQVGPWTAQAEATFLWRASTWR